MTKPYTPPAPFKRGDRVRHRHNDQKGGTIHRVECVTRHRIWYAVVIWADGHRQQHACEALEGEA